MPVLLELICLETEEPCQTYV